MVNSRIWLYGGLYGSLAIAGILIAENLIHSAFSIVSDLGITAIAAGLVGGGVFIWRKSIPKSASNAVLNRTNLEEKLQQLNLVIAKVAEPDREQLQLQATQITANLSQNQFRIAVCGNVSTGKTSVINALLGRKVGQTAARNGTTTSEQVYAYESQVSQVKPTETSLAKPKLSRQISLLDTPGISEKNELGATREVIAEQIAQLSDLLVFVTSSDLTATEYQQLLKLSKSGKRVILAFNKTDCYLPSDRQSIIDRLQTRTAKFLSPADVVAIAAQPSPIKVRQYASSSQPAKEWLEPVPADIQPLKQRIEEILSNEWEQLLIINTAQQIQVLYALAQSALYRGLRIDAEKIITKYQWTNAATVFANPFPGLDLIASTAINAQMLIELSNLYERPLSLKQAQKTALIISGTLLKFGCVEAASVAITACLKTNAITYAIGGSVQGISAAYLTYVGGTSFIAYLEQEPTYKDKPLNINTALRELCLSKFKYTQSGKFFTDFVNNAITQVNSNLSNLHVSVSKS